MTDSNTTQSTADTTKQKIRDLITPLIQAYQESGLRFFILPRNPRNAFIIARLEQDLYRVLNSEAALSSVDYDAIDGYLSGALNDAKITHAENPLGRIIDSRFVDALEQCFAAFDQLRPYPSNTKIIYDSYVVPEEDVPDRPFTI